MPAAQLDYGFPPYVPEDNEEILGTSSSESLSLVTAELGRLLSEPPSSFWAVCRNNKTLLPCLDSFLQYARKEHDTRDGHLQPSVTQRELQRLVFMVFLRMVTSEEAGPPARQQAKLLYDVWLLDVPKLMDIAVLYESQNAELVQKFMHQTFTLQPQYASDLISYAPSLAQNVQDVSQTCQQAARQCTSSGPSAASFTGLADGVAYLHDSSRTLTAFIRSYPPAALALAMGSEPTLLASLLPLHDELLPLLSSVAAFRLAAGSNGSSGASTPNGILQADVLAQVQHHSQGLRDSLPQLANLLITDGLLGHHSRASLGSGETPFTPEQRGQQLMDSLTCSELTSTSGAQASLLHVITRQYHVAAAIREALQQGRVLLDDVQQEYLFVQLGERAFSLQGSTPTAEPSTSGQQPGNTHEQQEAAIAQILEQQQQQQQPIIPEHPRAPAMSWNRVLDDDPSQPSASAPAPSAAPPKPSAHKGTAKALALPAADKAAVHHHAQAVQWDEWDDDYDDSFDDLGVGTIDGRTEVEGNEDDDLLGRPNTHRSTSQHAPPHQQANSRQNSRGPGKTSRLWVLDGRIYNYKKEGATEVSGQAQAQQLVQAAQEVSTQIHGLGPGGNVPLGPPQQPENGPAGAGKTHGQAGGQGSRQPPRQQAPEQSRAASSGGDRRSHAQKDKHKAAVANHHRKDRAMRKMGGPPA
ncbi:hypothetical protein WJX73_008497 [Symbiochloris irregularis]|uniref:CUE domain-containing protein n=1 Tax=Symbiochloris irregularis TaxID=706552 RepID=A0AAW1NWJ8_9CHLO